MKKTTNYLKQKQSTKSIQNLSKIKKGVKKINKSKLKVKKSKKCKLIDTLRFFHYRKKIYWEFFKFIQIWLYLKKKKNTKKKLNNFKFKKKKKLSITKKTNKNKLKKKENTPWYKTFNKRFLKFYYLTNKLLFHYVLYKKTKNYNLVNSLFFRFRKPCNRSKIFFIQNKNNKIPFFLKKKLKMNKMLFLKNKLRKKRITMFKHLLKLEKTLNADLNNFFKKNFKLQNHKEVIFKFKSKHNVNYDPKITFRCFFLLMQNCINTSLFDFSYNKIVKKKDEESTTKNIIPNTIKKKFTLTSKKSNIFAQDMVDLYNILEINTAGWKIKAKKQGEKKAVCDAHGESILNFQIPSQGTPIKFLSCTREKKFPNLKSNIELIHNISKGIFRRFYISKKKNTKNFILKNIKLQVEKNLSFYKNHRREKFISKGLIWKRICSLHKELQLKKNKSYYLSKKKKTFKQSFKWYIKNRKPFIYKKKNKNLFKLQRLLKTYKKNNLNKSKK